MRNLNLRLGKKKKYLFWLGGEKLHKFQGMCETINVTLKSEFRKETELNVLHSDAIHNTFVKL